MVRYIQLKPLSSAVLSFAVILFASALSAGDTQQIDQLTPNVDIRVLESKIEEVGSSTSLDEDSKNILTEQYRRALTLLEQSRTFKKDAETFKQARKKAPAEIEKLTEKLERNEKISAEDSLKISAKAPLSDIEELLQKEKADLAAVEAKLAEIKERIKLQEVRPAAARERLIVAQQDLEATIDERKLISGANESAETQARLWVLQAQALALSNEIKMLDQELLSSKSRAEFQQLRLKEAEFNVSYVSTRTRMLEELLSTRRLAEAEQVQLAAEAVIEELESAHPLVLEFAEKNIALGENIRARALVLEQLVSEDDKTRDTTRRIADDLSTAKQKLEIAGLSQALGQVLQEQSRLLPEISTLQSEASKREKQIANAGLMQIQYADDRRKLRDLDAAIAAITDKLAAEEIEAMRPELEKLISNRIDLLDKAIETEASYLRAMGELDLAKRQLINTIQGYEAFLGKRLLWIRSSDPVDFELVKKLPSEIKPFFIIANWTSTVRLFTDQLVDNPLMLLMFIALVMLTGMRGRFLRYAVATGSKIGHIRSDKFTYTMSALGWTLLASAALPVLLIFSGWQLAMAVDISGFTLGVAKGLGKAGNDLLNLLFFADVCIAGGLATKHFRWPQQGTAKLRSEFFLLIAVFIPAVLFANIGFQLDELGISSALVMLIIVIALGYLGIFGYRIFTPDGGVLKPYLDKRPKRILARFRRIWFYVYVGLIASLLVMVVNGYVFTGVTLARSFIDVLCLIFALIVLNAISKRWLMLISRRLAYKALIEKREQERAAQEAREEGETLAGGDEGMVEIEEPEIDFALLDNNSRTLLRVIILFFGLLGLWLILSPVLPALAILDDITLWQQLDLVDGEEQLVPVTLADMGFAIITAIITFGTAKGLPAILEILILQRTAVSAGSRFTIITLTRYTIVGTGIVAFFTILGGQWTQIQWLIAALGVGIGFGLQEIVANFISGLIILFERPIRVGDTVTVGDTSGVVTRIQIRATTITNWDRQELLVPNKEFITGRLLNWSLTDPVIRVVIPVGVAYGSDVTRAMQIMKEIAEQHDNVLEDPAPILAFENFGDNSLLLTLRAYLPSMENRLRTITELHTEINNRFNEAGIVIAFPQRDVHFDMSKPLEVKMHSGDAEKKE